MQTGSESSPTNTAGTGENEVVFRHNIHLRTPACDCGESEAFKSLMYRVNGLEEEVNYLKTQCADGCCSSKGAGNRSPKSQILSVLAPPRRSERPANDRSVELLTSFRKVLKTHGCSRFT